MLNHPVSRLSFVRIAVFLSLALALGGVPAQAQTHTWDGGSATTNNWNDAGNWDAAGVPAQPGTGVANIVFGGILRPAPAVLAAYDVSAITFNNTSGAFNIGSTGPLTVRAGGISNLDLQTQTFTVPLILGASQAWSATAGDLAINGALNLGTGALTVNGAKDVFFNSQVSGTGSLILSGTGEVQLNAGNTYSGGTTLNSGMLGVTAASVGGTLTLNGGTIQALTVPRIISNATTIGGNFTAGGSQSLTLTGPITLTGNRTIINNNTGTTTISGAIGQDVAGRAFTLAGTGTLAFTGATANTYTGLTTVNSGTLSLNKTAGQNAIAGNLTIGDGTGGAGADVVRLDNSTQILDSARITITSAGLLDLNGNADTVGTCIIEGGSITTGAGTLTITASLGAFPSAATTSTITGNLNLGGVTRIFNAQHGGGAIDLDIPAVISNGGIAFFDTGGVTRLSGLNTFSGGVAVRVGHTLLIANNQALGIGGTFSVNGGAVQADGAPRSVANPVALTADLTVGGAVDLTFTGAVTLTGNRTLTVTNTGSTTLTGVIGPALASRSLTKAGSQTLTLSGGTANTYTGPTTVADGRLNLAKTAGVNAVAGTLTIGDGTGSPQSAIAFMAAANQIANTGSVAIAADGLWDLNGNAETIASLDIAGGTLSVESGAGLLVTSNEFNVGSLNVGQTGIATVSGAGSTLTLQGTTPFVLGESSASTATLNVLDGAAFTTGTGTTTLEPTGVININGGTATFGGAMIRNGGTVNFNSGALSIVDNLTIGTGGLLGTSLTIDVTRHFTTTATTTIDPFRTLTIDGGTFSTSALINNGTLAFNSGTLAITGGGGFNIGTGALGSSVTLGTGANLQVTNATTVAGGALLRVDGGSFAGGNVTNNGTIDHRDGVLAFTGTLTNNAAGRVFISGLASPGGTIANAGRITMQNGLGFLGGAGAITNSGLLTGDGTIDKPVTNSAGGSIRAESGKTLTLTGTIAPNAGTLSLEGGTLEFATAITNSATGFISGRGALHTAGITNNGVMAFSGGNTDVFGDVTLTGGARLVTSGAGSTTTFFDDVTHNGTEIFTGVNGSSVFFGAQSGAGSFTGGGTIYFIGDLRPGSSPAAINFAPQVVFTPSNTLTLEIGGRIAGTEHDKLTFTHAATPQVEWGGTLIIELINGFTPAAGDTFDVFDFDAARDTGTFFSINVVDHGLMPAGLAFNFDELYTSGIIRVVSTTGTTFAQWAAAELADPGALPGGDHNNNGYDNLTEYALALHPPFPGASGPGGGFHVYPEGERLRVLFWRHIDRTDITIRVQVSADLVSWSDLAVSVNSAPFTGAGFVSENRAHPLPEPGLVEVRDILNANDEMRRYVRILVTLSP